MAASGTAAACHLLESTEEQADWGHRSAVCWLPGTRQASEATVLVIAWSGGSRFEAAVSPQLLAVQQMLTQVPTHMMLPLSV